MLDKSRAVDYSTHTNHGVTAMSDLNAQGKRPHWHSYSDPMSAAKTKTLRKLLETDDRIVGFTKEPDGTFIYTNSREWDDGNGAGTFREDTETAAVKKYKERVTRNTTGRI